MPREHGPSLPAHLDDRCLSCGTDPVRRGGEFATWLESMLTRRVYCATCAALHQEENEQACL